MFLQKVSLPIVSGMYATAHRITDTTSIYYSGFLLTWFRWKNSYSCLTVSNITLKVLLNVDHLKTHNMRLKTVRKKSKLSTRSFRNKNKLKYNKFSIEVATVRKSKWNAEILRKFCRWPWNCILYKSKMYGGLYLSYVSMLAVVRQSNWNLFDSCFV